MAYGRYGIGRLLSTVAVLVLLAGAAIATALLWYYGDWENHAWGLKLTLRIVWGVWVVILAATVLTRVTLFGWSFRNYLRMDEAGPMPLPRRATTAPWYKSAVTSFSVTVTLVSLTGLAAVGLAVMWILKDVTGPDIHWLVSTIIFASWWVLVIAVVLVRLAIFGKQKTTPAVPPPGTNTEVTP